MKELVDGAGMSEEAARTAIEGYVSFLSSGIPRDCTAQIEGLSKSRS